MDCLFCKIAKGEIPSQKVYEDEDVLIFKDISPLAKVHLLAIPKSHFRLLSDCDEKGRKTVARMLEIIPRVADKYCGEGGYRLVLNQGENAGQTVFHLHFHILGGEKLGADFAKGN